MARDSHDVVAEVTPASQQVGKASAPPAATLGLNSQTLNAPDLPTRLDAAASAGFRIVELTGDEVDPYLDRPQELRSELRQRGLTLLGVCPARDLTSWHHAWGPRLAALMRPRLELYQFLGADYLVLPFMDAEGDATSAADGLQAAATIADEVGISIAVESIGHVDKMRDVGSIRTLLHRVAAPNVGVALDSFHFFRAGHRLDDLDQLSDIQVRVVQVSNAVYKPIGELVGYRDRCFPLDGQFEVRAFHKDVRDRWPDAPITAEVMGAVPWSLDARSAAATAHQQLRTLTHYVPQRGA